MKTIASVFGLQSQPGSSVNFCAIKPKPENSNIHQKNVHCSKFTFIIITTNVRDLV